MKKLHIEYNRLRDLLEDCSLNQLDSIDILLSHAKSYDLDSISQLFNNVYQEKWNEHRNEYEGMNEYDYITRINNFDISTIVDYVYLNSHELVYFKKIMQDAITNIKNEENPLDLKIVPKIEEELGKVSYFLNDLESLNYIISDNELKDMFNKLNIEELEEFDIIFEYVEDYNVENMINILDKVKSKKIEKEENYEGYLKLDNDKSLLYDIRDRLSGNELNLLCVLLSDAIPSLIIYKKENGKDKSEKYNKLSALLSNLLESFVEEVDNNSKKTYKKTLSL